MSYEELVEKALKALERVDPQWGDQSAAIVGIGYAILALASIAKEASPK
ncbi:MAG: hypothetical protein AAB496_01415 [Patescibacteria group bacterium]